MATSSKSTHPPKSLQKFAEDAAIEALDKLSTRLSSIFCCGGRLQPAQSGIRLHYEIDGNITKIIFPGADEAALAKLMSTSFVTSFGKANQQVSAYEIDPDKFMTSFYPCNAKILGEIESLMVPNGSRIRAELNKLNLCTGPGGHFKSARVDTPRSLDMFGSLVVCFPTQFSGGALVTRHGDQKVVYDWSSTPDDPLSEVCWAAYFSDVEHEFLPVTSGHRLTLTYSLYAEKEKLHSVPPGSPFHNYLQRAIGTPHFMREGGCLIFDCEHLYDFASLNDKEKLPHVLKGADSLIFSTANILNLRVTIKPISQGYDYTSLLPYFPCYSWRHYRVDEGSDEKFCDEFDVNVIVSARWQILLDAMDSEDDEPIVLPADSIKNFSGGICWSSQQMNPSLGWILYSYKQEFPVCQSAVILVEVPPWGDPPRTLAPDSDAQPPAEKKQKIEQEYRRLFDEDNEKLFCWKND
jgi:hypothetical protein